MAFVIELAYLAMDVFAILLLMAIWQRSRIRGFLVLAASYVLTILGRWGMSLAYRLGDGDAGMSLAWISSSVWLAISAVGVYGLWDIYRHFRARSAAPSAN